jgi:hypothetical protein
VLTLRPAPDEGQQLGLLIGTVRYGQVIAKYAG